MRTTALVMILMGLAASLPAQMLHFAPHIPMPADRDQNSYEIYSLLLKSGPIEWRDAPRSLWLIEATTHAVPLDAPCQTDTEHGMNPHTAVIPPADSIDEFNAVLADYDEHCHDAIQLDQGSFNTELPVHLLDTEGKQKLMKMPNEPSSELHHAAGLHRFTEVFFNPNQTMALVQQGMWCGIRCGKRTWVVLERNQGQWKVLPWTISSAVS